MGSRSGELALRPLPAVLLDLNEDGVTGKLVLKRGRVSKTVDLVNGNPVSAASTPRDETLGHFLVANGIITEDQHRQAVARASEGGGKLGEALIGLGAMSVETLIDQLGKQARHKLVQALRWPQGAWRFDDALEAIEGIPLRMVEVVLGGLRETAVEDLDRLARLDAMTFELTARGQRLRHELKRAFGERAITLLANRAPIGEIERAFPDRVSARAAVDAMLMCDTVVSAVVEVGLGSGLSLPRAPTKPRLAGSALFDILFDDLGTEVEGAAPLDFPDADSGVVSTADLDEVTTGRDRAALAVQSLTAEHQRVRGADHYSVLLIGRRASPDEIEAAFTIRSSLIEQDFQHVSDALDRAKFEDLRKVYAAARTVLLDERKRSAYDRELAGGELVQVPPAIDSELTFRMAEESIARGQWIPAINLIKTVIARSPGEADYHAALGWCEWQAGGAREGDVARRHLNQALAINPDHAAAHDYKGRIDAALHSDDAEALFHLERAIDIDPARVDAVAAIESLLLSRGELRRLERVLKRVLFRLRGRSTIPEAKAWARLARLYVEQLDDVRAGAAAAANARRIAPRDSDVAALVQPRRAGTLEPLRAGWREALGDPQSGAALVMNAAASGHPDAAFLAASTMVALGTADAQMSAIYEARRVHAAIAITAPFGRDQWALLRHKDDSIELGGLIELVAPAIHALAPMTLRDSELDPEQRLADGDVPAPFARSRQRLADLLGVPAAPIYARVELGSQIHVVACDPPVLVAGDEALTAPERPDLVFRLARAMTFLWPGRAVGASRPGRTLRAIVLAIFREASGSPVGADDAVAGAASDAIGVLPPELRTQARAAALRMMSRGNGLNLTLWSRSLSRTADRAGMLLCGDVPAALSGASEVGELDRDLIEFAYSAAHVSLREELGLSANDGG